MSSLYNVVLTEVDGKDSPRDHTHDKCQAETSAKAKGHARLVVHVVAHCL